LGFLKTVKATQLQVGMGQTLSPGRAFWWWSLWFNSGPHINGQLNALESFAKGKAAAGCGALTSARVAPNRIRRSELISKGREENQRRWRLQRTDTESTRVRPRRDLSVRRREVHILCLATIWPSACYDLAERLRLVRLLMVVRRDPAFSPGPSMGRLSSSNAP
jgi:hypothetical protein